MTIEQALALSDIVDATKKNGYKITKSNIVSVVKAIKQPELLKIVKRMSDPQLMEFSR